MTKIFSLNVVSFTVRLDSLIKEIYDIDKI